MKKLNVQDVYVGKQQRIYVSVCVDRNDEYAYIGTQTGDVVKISLNCGQKVNVLKSGNFSSMIGAYGTHNIRKPFGKDCDRYVNGLRVVHIVGDGLLLMGAGDGVVELVEERRDIKDNVFKNYPSPTWPMLKTVSCKGNLNIIFILTFIFILVEENESKWHYYIIGRN